MTFASGHPLYLGGSLNSGLTGIPVHNQHPQYNEAINLIQKIKTRFSSRPNDSTFSEFLNVLNTYRSLQGHGYSFSHLRALRSVLTTVRKF